MSSGSVVQQHGSGGTVVKIVDVRWLHDQCAQSATPGMGPVASIVALAATFPCVHGADLARAVRIGKGEAVV